MESISLFDPQSESTIYVHLPDDYVKPLLPGRDEWCATLRTTTDLQGEGTLCSSEYDSCDPGAPPVDKFCCLGILSKLQGALDEGKSLDRWTNAHILAEDLDKHTGSLSEDNPLFAPLSGMGKFPEGVGVGIGEGDSNASLAEVNDSGSVSFAGIAEIIEHIWADGGPLPKKGDHADGA